MIEYLEESIRWIPVVKFRKPYALTYCTDGARVRIIVGKDNLIYLNGYIKLQYIEYIRNDVNYAENIFPDHSFTILEKHLDYEKRKISLIVKPKLLIFKDGSELF